MVLKGFASGVKKRSIVSNVIKSSTTNPSYYLLLSLSTLIVTLGLSISNEAVIIGGMLMAPLLRPILALGLALVTVSHKSLARSLLGIVNSISIIMLLSFLVSLAIHDQNFLTPEILNRGIYSELYLFIAILSGLGATYTLIDPRISSALPGVAVAVSLLPPLCVSGIALAQSEMHLLASSLQIFSINFAGITLASTLMFLIFRFPNLKKHEEKKIIEEEKKE